MSKRPRPTAPSYSQGTRRMAHDPAGRRPSAKEIEVVDIPDVPDPDDFRPISRAREVWVPVEPEPTPVPEPQRPRKQMAVRPEPAPPYVSDIARRAGNEARCSSCNRLLWTWEDGPPVAFEQRTKCARCKCTLVVVTSSTMVFAKVRVVSA